MNNKECYKYVQKLLKDWKIKNNYTCKCVVHHRDDTDECRNYNKAHYERWGFNEDGTFEYGKYVIFMTHADHSSYHNSGDKCSMKRPEVRAKMSTTKKGRVSTFKCKHHSEESKQKLRESHLGKKASEETRKKLSELRKGEKHWNYGKHPSEETRQKMSESRKGENNGFYGKKHSEETLQHLREICKLKLENDALHYHKYKANNGTLSWYEFRKLFHNNDPQVMQHLID